MNKKKQLLLSRPSLMTCLCLGIRLVLAIHTYKISEQIEDNASGGAYSNGLDIYDSYRFILDLYMSITFTSRWSSRPCLVELTDTHLRAFQLVPSHAFEGTAGLEA